MTSNTSPYGWRFWYVLFSIMCAIYVFFLNSGLLETFQENLIKEYFDFVRTIYYPQTIYLAESILFPWVAYLVGAGKHWLYYKIYCSFAIVMVLPAIAFFAMNYFNTATKSWCFFILFLTTFKYYWGPYYIGMPDPFVVIFLVACSLERSPKVLFIFVVLATLTHFTITLIALASIVALLIASPAYTRLKKLEYIKYVVAGVLTGRALLQLWYYRFNYAISDRIDYASDLGLRHFVTRYERNPVDFWLAPGVTFFFVLIIMLAVALFKKQIFYASAMLLTLTFAYISYFFTVDGLRVFGLVMVAPFSFMLRNALDQLPWLSQNRMQSPADSTS